MRIAWLTDINLNFLKKEERLSFYQEVNDKECDHVFITGDISEYPSLISDLKEIEENINIKGTIFFILGNHDYYRGSIQEVSIDIQSNACEIGNKDTKLKYMHNRTAYLNVDSKTGKAVTRSSNYVRTPDDSKGWHKMKLDMETKCTVLGINGWADCRLGDYNSSPVILNDHSLIRDFRGRDKQGIFNFRKKLADYDARKLSLSLHYETDAKKIIILTHVPPFEECCLYKGRISGHDYLPFYTCKAIGDVIKGFAQRNPNIEILVLCGHTHNEAEVKILDNLTVMVGSAEYGRAKISEIIDV